MPNFQTVTQDVDLGVGGVAGAIVDLSIPTGQTVTGSGVLILDVWDPAAGSNGEYTPPTNTLINNGEAEQTVTSSGPHPSDSTKWRFVVYAYQEVRARCWLIAASSLLADVAEVTCAGLP